MPSGSLKTPSQRQLRVGEELRHILANMFQRGMLNDPALRGASITITEVKVSPDLKNATAYLIPLSGGAVEIDKVLEGLGRAAPYIRRVLGSKVRLRHIPRLDFIADKTLEDANHIEELLRELSVARDLKSKDGEPDL